MFSKILQILFYVAQIIWELTKKLRDKTNKIAIKLLGR